MSIHPVKALLISSSALAAIAAQPAFAQGPAAEAIDDSEIIVTGERIARSINETSSSIHVETMETLSQRSTDNVTALLGQLANVQLAGEGSGPVIRGQDTSGPLTGADSFLGGTRPRTTIQIDGRAVGYNEFIYGMSSLWDVERVEVFRTPQTTTQGRNAIAGAIFIKTADPSFEPEGRVRALVGNYDTFQLSGMVSAPIVADQIAVRATFDRRTKKTTVNLYDFDFGFDERADNFTNGRVKLLIKPTNIPDLRLDVIYTHLETDAPQNLSLSQPWRDRSGDINNTPAQWRINVDAITGIAAYGDKDNVLVTLTPNYTDTLTKRLTQQGNGDAIVRTKEFTFEGIVSAKISDSFSVLAGLYHLDTDQVEAIDLSLFLGLGDFTDKQKSFGVFGEFAVKPIPGLTLTGGLRYQRDRQDRVGTLDIFAVDYHRSFDAFLPKVSLAYEVSDRVNVGVLAQRAFNPGGTTISFNTALQDFFEAETLWNYEAFVRARLGSGIQLNANVFYTDFTNAQRTTTTVTTNPLGQPVFETDIGNVSKARSYGVEIELDAKISPTLSLRLAGGYLNSKITDTLDPLDPLRGAIFARAPEFSGSAAINWEALPGLNFDTQVRTGSRYFSDDANTPSFRVSGSTNVDAKVSYTWRSFTASAYVRNAFDTFSLTEIYDSDFASANEPRTYGISLEVKF